MLTKNSASKSRLAPICVVQSFKSDLGLGQGQLNLPCTVDCAPNDAKAPKVPTMKYWNTLFLSSPLLDLYLPKLGILSVPVDAMPLNGESNDEVVVVSTLRFWIRAEEVRTAGNCCRT